LPSYSIAVAWRTLLRRFLPPSIVPRVAYSRYHATLRRATLSDATARRLTEQLGAVADEQTQAAIARAQQGQPVCAEAEVQGAHDTTILAVEVDGVLVHHDTKEQARHGEVLCAAGNRPASGRELLR
jgi:hypothetical protein